ncbi:hypothetical protein I79_020253 [Cricetulus griseus]|uniref:Uncharacterized protein n=1 Tax=Cricetulus griseus TaxID=10029 RepID=G3I9K4_CRIGR|nr:hypothetical protein I79_020253 [Cricetulus griseus]
MEASEQSSGQKKLRPRLGQIDDGFVLVAGSLWLLEVLVLSRVAVSLFSNFTEFD